MKNISQFISYILEIIFFIASTFTIINLIKNKPAFNWINELNSFEFFEKATALFVIYQILIFAVLSLNDSSKRDALLTNIKLIKLIIVRLEHGMDFYSLLDEMAETYNNPSVFFYKEDKEFIKEVQHQTYLLKTEKMDKNTYCFYLKNKLVNLEHSYEFYTLEWRLSFVLRIRK